MLGRFCHDHVDGGPGLDEKASNGHCLVGSDAARDPEQNRLAFEIIHRSRTEREANMHPAGCSIAEGELGLRRPSPRCIGR